MVDDGFTYGGALLAAAAIAWWAWIAVSALPSLAGLISRYEDDLGLGRTEPRANPRSLGFLGRPERAAFALTVVAIVCQSIGFAIPD